MKRLMLIGAFACLMGGTAFAQTPSGGAGGGAMDPNMKCSDYIALEKQSGTLVHPPEMQAPTRLTRKFWISVVQIPLRLLCRSFRRPWADEHGFPVGLLRHRDQSSGYLMIKASLC
jgi:hypothetical protein